MVSTSPSGSVSLARMLAAAVVTPSGVFSPVANESAAGVGASFTGWTSIDGVAVLLIRPSVVVMESVSVPVKFRFGV